MHKYIYEIKEHLRQQQIQYDHSDIHTLLEQIWRTYTESNPISNNRLQELNERMGPYFDSLSIEDSDNLFSLFCDFCAEYERVSFLEGIRIGARMMIEIYEASAKG